MRLSAIFAAAFLSTTLLANSSPSAAMVVAPVHVEMTSAGSGGRAQVTVTNDSHYPLPVETSVEKMKLDENGGHTLSKAGNEFMVFPPQALIPAGGSQVFRVQWVGEPMLGESQSFILAITQIPLKMSDSKKGVQVVASLGVNINVAPPQATASLKLVGAEIATAKDGKRQPTITVENPTKTHALLPQFTIRLTGDGGWSRTMAVGELSSTIGIGLVQPGKRRRFTLPVDLPAGVSKVQVALDLKPKR